MSDYEESKGKLKELIIPANVSMEEYCQAILLQKGIRAGKSTYEEGEAVEYLKYHYSQGEKYVVIENRLYKILERTDIDPSGDIYEAKQHENNIISFHVRYYNGGCGFFEAIETALEQLEERK